MELTDNEKYIIERKIGNKKCPFCCDYMKFHIEPYCMVNEENTHKKYFLLVNCCHCGLTEFYDLSIILGKDWRNKDINSNTEQVKSWN